MNLEAKFKSALVTAIKELNADYYARRHEDKYALGLLDLSIKIPGHPHLMAEGKLVPHQKFAPTLRQWVEGENYRRAGGLCCLIGWDPKTKVMFIHEWAREASRGASWPPGGSYMNHAQTLKDWLEWIKTKPTATSL